MLLGEALNKSKIAMLRWVGKLVLVTSMAAYEATLIDIAGCEGAYVFKKFKVVKNFNDIPDSKEWEALGYHEK